MADTCEYTNLFEFRQYDGQCDFFGGTTPLPVRSKSPLRGHACGADAARRAPAPAAHAPARAPWALGLARDWLEADLGVVWRPVTWRCRLSAQGPLTAVNVLGRTNPDTRRAARRQGCPRRAPSFLPSVRGRCSAYASTSSASAQAGAQQFRWLACIVFVVTGRDRRERGPGPAAAHAAPSSRHAAFTCA